MVVYCNPLQFIYRHVPSPLVIDIETQNTFQEVGKYDCHLLKVSLVGVYDYATGQYESYLEADLPALWKRMEAASVVVGYNIIGFDLPVLNNYYPGDLLKLPRVDIMYMLEEKIGFRVKLDDVAQATLGVGKSGNGLMAVEYWKKGEIDKLREYCLQDVRVTKELFDYIQSYKHAKYRDRSGAAVTVPLAVEVPVTHTSINLTMPF